MKNKKRVLPILALTLLGGGLVTTDVFAANPYGIEYSGGTELGTSNLTGNADLIDGLTQIVSDSEPIKESSSSRWANAYHLYGEECRASKYIRVSPSKTIDAGEDISFEMTRGQYLEKVNLKKVTLEGFGVDVFGNKDLAISVDLTGKDSLAAGRTLYSDSACKSEIGDLFDINGSGDFKNRRVFIETVIDLQRNNKALASDEVYFALTDVDFGQSYKILNSDNLLNKSNMFVKDVSTIQPKEGDSRNMFVSSGNYIYSQRTEEGVPFDIESGSNIYIKMNSNTLKDGLNIVFGYANNAASGVQFYGKQYEVKYISDNNGAISGIKNEDVLSGGNPTGSSTTPKEGYVLSYWVPDVDVKLIDGTVIKAGEKMTAEQVKNVVVTQNITFEAIHETIPVDPEEENPEIIEPAATVAAPETGAATGETNAVAITVSVMGVLAVALFARLAPRMFHKKMDFKK